MRPTARIARVAASVAAATLILLGCSEPPAAPEPEVITETPTADPVDKEAVPAPAQEEVWPLTGVPGTVAQRPVMSIKVENSAQARPQTGLQEADLVWEQLIEGGYTRFLAMYHSELPEVVGPIRSLRPSDLPIAVPYGGQLVYSGGQRAFLGAAQVSPLQILSHDAGAAGFFRSGERFAPHNLYGRPDDFLAAGGDAPDSEPVFEFAPQPQYASAVTDGDAATTITSAFPSTSPSWQWQGDDGVWARSEDGQSAQTTDSGRLTAVNVLVLRVEVRNTQFTDPSGAPVPDIDLSGSGEALIATGGHTVAGTWSKDGEADLLTLTGDDGEPVLLEPGNTWIELLPTSGSSLSVD